jgi:hypothetical protein
MYGVALHCTVPCCTLLHCGGRPRAATVWFCTVQYRTVSNSTLLHSSTPPLLHSPHGLFPYLPYCTISVNYLPAFIPENVGGLNRTEMYSTVLDRIPQSLHTRDVSRMCIAGYSLTVQLQYFLHPSHIGTSRTSSCPIVSVSVPPLAQLQVPASCAFRCSIATSERYESTLPQPVFAVNNLSDMDRSSVEMARLALK